MNKPTSKQINTKSIYTTGEDYVGNPQDFVLDESNTLRAYDGQTPGGRILVSDSPVGWADYADNATHTTPITLTSGDWTSLTNDGLGFEGANTNETYLTNGIEHLWDTTNNKIMLDGCKVGQQVDVRVDVKITPTVNDTSIGLRFFFETPLGDFALQKGLSNLNEGAGIAYDRVEFFTFFIGDQVIIDSGGSIQLRASSDATVTITGFYIGVRR